ncbi:hypothetical protein BA894_22850 [Vibrio natriegens]|nr:hypothetical protein BA894_22850 [Vibrio natriegens]
MYQEPVRLWAYQETLSTVIKSWLKQVVLTQLQGLCDDTIIMYKISINLTNEITSLCKLQIN